MAKQSFKTTGNLYHVYNTEQAMDMLNEDLLGVIQQWDDAVCIADGDSRMLLLNPAFERVMGVKNSECIGRRITDMVQHGMSDTAASIKVMESGRNETVMIKMATGHKVISTGTPVYDGNQRIRRILCSLRRYDNASIPRAPFNTKATPSVNLNWLQKLGHNHPQLITHNKAMMRVAAFAQRMALVDSSVLITGESGVGKDLIARLIHEASPRRRTGELVKVNCGAIPENLLESEFFGYEPGAFTGAGRNGKVGFFEMAHKGTLFLDEIGELPPNLQVKLLAVLQDRQFRRIGGTTLRNSDFRLLTATNSDLEALVRAGTFREDLYFRINVVPLHILPLRRRRDEIPHLIDHFLWRTNARYHLNVAMDETAVTHLCRYAWPGNVRELQNLVERLVVTCDAPLITRLNLPERYIHAQEPVEHPMAEGKSLKEAVDDYELDLIRETLSMTGSHEAAAAKLGISMSTLTRRLRKMRASDADGQF